MTNLEHQRLSRRFLASIMSAVVAGLGVMGCLALLHAPHDSTAGVVEVLVAVLCGTVVIGGIALGVRAARGITALSRR